MLGEAGVGRRKGLLKGELGFGGVFNRNGRLGASENGGGGSEYEEVGGFLGGLITLGGGMFGLKSLGSVGGEEAVAGDTEADS